MCKNVCAKMCRKMCVNVCANVCVSVSVQMFTQMSTQTWAVGGGWWCGHGVRTRRTAHGAAVARRRTQTCSHRCVRTTRGRRPGVRVRGYHAGGRGRARAERASGAGGRPRATSKIYGYPIHCYSRIRASEIAGMALEFVIGREK